MNSKVLTASANTGVGFWTSLCVFGCSIFGKESKAYAIKQKRVLTNANKRLMEQLNALGYGYTLTDYRVTWYGNLSVTVSALAVKDGTGNSIEKACPKCGAPIDDEMCFCGECGENLK